MTNRLLKALLRNRIPVGTNFRWQVLAVKSQIFHKKCRLKRDTFFRGWSRFGIFTKLHFCPGWNFSWIRTAFRKFSKFLNLHRENWVFPNQDRVHYRPRDFTFKTLMIFVPSSPPDRCNLHKKDWRGEQINFCSIINPKIKTKLISFL